MTHVLRTRRFLVLAASSALAAGAVLLPTGAFAATAASTHTVAADGDPAPGDCNGPGNPACSARTDPLLPPVGEPDGQGPVLVINPEVTPPDVKTDPGKHGQGKHGQGKGHPGKTGRTGGGVVVVQTPNTRDWVCDVAPCGPPTHPQIEAL
nr:hypothetical protein OG513_16615 [Streptomyces sp. NBC_00998]